MPVLSELAALEVANGLVGSSQLIAPLLCNELLGIAEAHAEHCLDLEDERWDRRVVRTASRGYTSKSQAL